MVIPKVMSQKKKKIREDFRNACFKRDNFKCVMCGYKELKKEKPLEDVYDAHHITNRDLMPNGGYVKENGITLCPICHERAEVFHSTGDSFPGYSPADLYKKINSSYERAFAASKKL